MNLPGTVTTAPDPDALFDRLGSQLMAAAMRAADERERFHLALSGGSTPEPFYMRLVTDPKFRAIPWKLAHLWIVDERQVPSDHEKSNFRMLTESLIGQIPTPESQVHRVKTELDDPAADYRAQLEDVFGRSPAGDLPRLDFVLLGMGDDCHTASLFPGSPALEEDALPVVNNDGDRVVPPARVTMTYPLLNAARELAVLAVGAKKHAALQRVADLGGAEDRTEVPISGIRPGDHAGGTLTWYLDDASAGVG